MKLRTIGCGLLIATLYYVGGVAIDVVVHERDYRPVSNLGMIVAGFYIGTSHNQRRGAPAQPSDAPAT